MARCAYCGTESPPAFAFCGQCGKALPAIDRDRAASRRVVTVLFVDVVGSTEIGEHADPERVRPIMERYFDIARGVIERHGGTVEKFIGDAVMAVFGIPVLHEDDALRAVRAAAEVRDALADSQAAGAADDGIDISIRIGLSTGEVMVGGPRMEGTLVTGGAVNTAARLEAAADPGVILVDESTHRLLRRAAATESVGEIPLKGKEHPIRAYRLLSVAPVTEPIAPLLEAPMVGRASELDVLRRIYEDVTEAGRCRLVTIIGSGGVGKSRLVREFLADLSTDVEAVRGRCLPYGEGITWWPVIELVRSIAGVVEADDATAAIGKVRAVMSNEPDGDLVTQRIAELTRWTTADITATQDDLFWGVRRMLEAVASTRPIIVVFDDLQWADAAFLDLVEHIAEWTQDAPLFLLCMARPELLDVRPTWSGGRLNSTTVLLEALSPTDAGSLVGHLIGEGTLGAAELNRMLEAAEGNPLFVEEIIGMLVDDGALVPDAAGWQASTAKLGAVAIPPTISALLAARLDQLPALERALAQRASIIGRVFERDAVTHLTPEANRSSVPALLQALSRRQLVARIRADEVYRFRHLLVRDAAYAGLPKSERAELHERFADWLEEASGDRKNELEAVLGYHLEQAHEHLSALGGRGEDARAVGIRAGRWLSLAGRRADEQRNATAAIALLRRAMALLPPDDPDCARAESSLGSALLDAGETNEAIAALDHAIEHAPDADADVRARLYRFIAQTFVKIPPRAEAIHQLAVLLRASRFSGDRTQCEIRREATSVYADLGDLRRAELWARRALRYGDRLGGTHSVNAKLDIAFIASRGGTPISEVIALCEDVMRSEAHTAAKARALGLLALAHGAQGRADEGRRALDDSRLVADRLGLASNQSNFLLTAGHLEMAAGEPMRAEEHYRDMLDQGVGQGLYVGYAGYLHGKVAECLVQQGRWVEAEELARQGLDIDPDDPWSIIVGASTLARCLARRESVAEALELIDRVEAIAHSSGLVQNPIVYGAALEDKAAVLIAADRRTEALEVLEEARRRYESKEAWAFVERIASVQRSIQPPGSRL